MTELATFRQHLKKLDRYATVVKAPDGLLVRSNLYWSAEEAVEAFRPGLPTIVAVSSYAWMEGSKNRGRWCRYIWTSAHLEKIPSWKPENNSPA
jgi:hypothetical protein